MTKQKTPPPPTKVAEGILPDDFRGAVICQERGCFGAVTHYEEYAGVGELGPVRYARWWCERHFPLRTDQW